LGQPEKNISGTNSITILTVEKVNAVMLSVVMTSVVAPEKLRNFKHSSFFAIME
jgi:hypothetical protein